MIEIKNTHVVVDEIPSDLKILTGIAISGFRHRFVPLNFVRQNPEINSLVGLRLPAAQCCRIVGLNPPSFAFLALRIAEHFRTLSIQDSMNVYLTRDQRVIVYRLVDGL